MASESETGRSGGQRVWVGVPTTKEEQLRQLLTVVSDALRNTRDAVRGSVTTGNDLAFTIDQVERARAHLRACARSLAMWKLELDRAAIPQ